MWIEVIGWLLCLSFLVPLAELLVALFCCFYAWVSFRSRPENYAELIIQICSVGREVQLVQNAINTINSYDLTFPYRIWVVIEPGHRIDYEGCERVIVVSEEFTCKPVDKARALEYCLRIRRAEGLSRPDVKLLLADDDSLPSKRYVNMAYAGDFEIGQGLTVANRWYCRGGGIQHWLMSHLDDPRPRNCCIYCGLTQGFTERPVYAHGEGLAMTADIEDLIGWDVPIVGSDDLVFGLRAADQGVRWTFFLAAIQIISPWTFREHLTQRHRWTWGNIDLIRSRDIVPAWGAALIAFKYAFSFISVAMSTAAWALILSGVYEIPRALLPLYLISFWAWPVTYAIPAFLSTGGQPNRELRPQWDRYWGFRLRETVAGALLTPITALLPTFVIAWALFKGRPTRFAVIAKNNSATKL